MVTTLWLFRLIWIMDRFKVQLSEPTLEPCKAIIARTNSVKHFVVCPQNLDHGGYICENFQDIVEIFQISLLKQTSKALYLSNLSPLIRL